MIDVPEWARLVRQMEADWRRGHVWWFVVFGWEPDEVAAAEDFLEQRLGTLPEIRAAHQPFTVVLP